MMQYQTSQVNLIAVTRLHLSGPNQLKKLINKSKCKAKSQVWSNAGKVRMRYSIIVSRMIVHRKNKQKNRKEQSMRSMVASMIALLLPKNLVQLLWNSLPKDQYSIRILRSQLTPLLVSAQRVNIHVLARTMLIQDHHKLTNLLRQLHKERLERIPNKISKPN